MASNPPSYAAATRVDIAENITESLAATSIRGEIIKFQDCKMSFAVDQSGSTMGRVLELEKFAMREVSKGLSNTAHRTARVLPWSSSASSPIRLRELELLESFGGTFPQSLLLNPECRQNLQSTDIWFLLTDGQISERSVQQFAIQLAQAGLHGVACVIIIFGPAEDKPATCNISVGLSVFAVAPDCLFLFFDTITQQMRILQCSGRFTQILELRNEDQPMLEDSTNWSDLPKIEFSDFNCVSIRAPVKLHPDEILLPDGLLLDLKDLWSGRLNDGDTIDRIFNNDDNLKSIMLTAQTRGEVSKFQNWLKPFLDDVSSPLKEIPDLGREAIRSVRQIIEEMQSGPSEDRLEELQRDLRRSYAQNSDAEASDSAVRRRRSSQAAYARSSIGGLSNGRLLNSIVADHTPRSSRRQYVPTNPSRQGLMTQGFRKPDNPRDMFVGDCPLCGGTNVNLVLLLRAPPGSSVTEGFPVPNSATELTCPLAIGNFPETDVICSSVCCDTCSYYLAQGGRTPQNEVLTCVLPLVTFAINQQAYKRQLKAALDNRFHEDGLAQIFLAIVVNTFQRLPPKSSFDLTRSALKWMCRDLLTRYLCPADVFSSQPDIDATGTTSIRALGVTISSAFESVYKSLASQSLQTNSIEAEELFSYPLSGFIVMVQALQHARVSPNLPMGTQNILWQRFLYQLIENYLEMEEVENQKPVFDFLSLSLAAAESGNTPLQNGENQTDNQTAASNSSIGVSVVMDNQPINPFDKLVKHGLLAGEDLREFRLLGELFDWIEKRATPAVHVFIKSLVVVNDRDQTPWEVFDALRRDEGLKKVFEEPLGIYVHANTKSPPVVRSTSPMIA